MARVGILWDQDAWGCRVPRTAAAILATTITQIGYWSPSPYETNRSNLTDTHGQSPTGGLAVGRADSDTHTNPWHTKIFRTKKSNACAFIPTLLLAKIGVSRRVLNSTGMVSKFWCRPPKCTFIGKISFFRMMVQIALVNPNFSCFWTNVMDFGVPVSLPGKTELIGEFCEDKIFLCPLRLASTQIVDTTALRTFINPHSAYACGVLFSNGQIHLL